MRKLILATTALLLTALPAVAQITLPGHYSDERKERARFTKPVVFRMGAPNGAPAGGQDTLVAGTMFRLNAQTGSVTTGNTTVGLTLPANTLVTTGHAIRVRVFGTTAANANTKVVTFIWGSTTITLLNAAANAKDFYADIVVTRTGANAQLISVAGYANGALLNGLSVTSAQTETSAINCQVQLGTATANNDALLDDVSILGESG